MPRRSQLQLLLADAHELRTVPQSTMKAATRRRALSASLRRITRMVRAERLKNLKARVQNVFEKFRRGRRFTVTSHGAYGPFPEDIVRTILQQFAGRTVRIVAYNGTPGEFVRNRGDVYGNPIGLPIVNWDGNTVGGDPVKRFVTPNGDRRFDANDEIKTLDHIYAIPAGSSTAVDRWYNGKDGNQAVGTDWLFTYNTSSDVPMGQPEPVLHPGDTIVVYEATSVISQPGVVQQFARGVSHCLIQPIINYFEQKGVGAKSKDTKKSCETAIERLRDYATTYAGGISVPAVHRMVEDVSTTGQKFNLNIWNPCARKGEGLYLRVENQYAHGKTFDFVNWELNHVDELQTTYKDCEPIEMTREQLKAKLNELNTTETFCEWKRDSLGVSTIYTADSTYKCHVRFGERYRAFSEKYDLAIYQIDHVGDQLLSNFVLAGTHYCCTASFNTLEAVQSDAVLGEIQPFDCWDISKSYARPHDSPFYEGFPGKLTSVRPCTRVMGPGLYRIRNINTTMANPKLVEILNYMGVPIRDGLVYVLPILRCLDHYGVTYEITMGAWAGASENRFDFEFPPEMIENKDYAIVVGMWNCLKHDNVTYMRGDRKFASHLQANAAHLQTQCMAPCDADEWEGGTIRASYPAKHVWHMSHLTAYINGYEFTKMVTQLMHVDLTKVVQLQKDDFICVKHEFALQPYMCNKTEELYEVNEKGETKLARKLGVQLYETFHRGTLAEHTPSDLCYLSGVDDLDNPIFEVITREAQAHAERFAHIDYESIVECPVVSLEGAGGSGKSDCPLRDKLLCRPTYLAQSHKLSRAKAAEYTLTGCEDMMEEIKKELEKMQAGRKMYTKARGDVTLEVSVWARALHESPTIWALIHRYANCLVIDETSMMSTETARFLMERFKRLKICFAGDPGFQLALYKRSGDEQATPFSASALGIPRFEFSKIFRVQCEKLMAIRIEGRAMLENGKTMMSHEEYREMHAGDCFPPWWGQETRKKTSPVAGLTFSDVEELHPWYYEVVACSAERGLMAKFRRYMDHEFHEQSPIGVDEIEAFYKGKFKTVSSFEEVAELYQAHEKVGDDYIPKDLIICSTNEFADQWTDYLTPLQPVVRMSRTVTKTQGSLFEHFKGQPSEIAYIHRKQNFWKAVVMNTEDGPKLETAKKSYARYTKLLQKMAKPTLETHEVVDDVQLQKYKMLSCTRDHLNGEIFMAAKKPSDGDCKIAHAFTAHATIGETARGKVFIDRRNMFEIEHWETIVGRAKRWEDIIIVDLPDPDPADRWKNTKIYLIDSKIGNCCYVGHTGDPAIRKKRHIDDYKNKKLKKRCNSHMVLKYKDWTFDVIEEYPCETRRQAEKREAYHIQQYPTAVNKMVPSGDSLPQNAPKKRKVEVTKNAVAEATIEEETEEEYTRRTDDELTVEEWTLIADRMNVAIDRGIHPTAEYTTDDYWEIAEDAYFRGYRNENGDDVFFTEYCDDLAAGYISARLYYILHSNPEQYGEKYKWWFDDDTPNMMKMRNEFRRFDPTDMVAVVIAPTWVGYEKYGF